MTNRMMSLVLTLTAAGGLPLLAAAPASASDEAQVLQETLYCVVVPSVSSGGTTVFPGTQVCVPGP